MKIHIVQKGDTLWKIAKKYGVNFEELKKMNAQLSNPDMIMPGMKVKVPTSGGMVKKANPKVESNPGTFNAGTKKEMPIAEQHPIKEQPVPSPIAVTPVKEAPMPPIVKEAPIAPVPPMPQPVVPEIDINNYYMLNMANMSVQQPQPPLQPAPAPILPAKEMPKEVYPESPVQMPIQAPIQAPIQMPCEGGVEQPMCPEYCVPVTPVMPGPGFNYPWGYPQQPMPYAPVQGAMMPPVGQGMYPGNPGVMGAVPMPAQVSQGTVQGGAPYMPYYQSEESSSFMPQMPMGQMPMGQMGQMPMGQMPMGQMGQMPMGQMPMGQMGQMPMGQMPMGQMGQMPMGQMPMGQMGQMPMGQMPMGQMGQMPMGQMPMGQMGQMPMYQRLEKEAPIVQQQPILQPAPAPVMQAPAPPPVMPEQPVAQMPVYPEAPMAPVAPVGEECYPVSPVMPGPGFTGPAMGYPYAPMSYGYPQMGQVPHVQGMMMNPGESSDMMGMNPGMQMPMAGYPAGMQSGMMANPQAGGMQSPMVMQGTPPVYSAPYGGQMYQAPYMSPYGMGPMGTTPYAMPRLEEGSEYDD
ncbi:SafA/ExsA family spore coat assembly protein [Neobacillus terrae]|uniref:SafA/ExsA family spore coat assembly protein n=1 Tax=Neobacillus terrae TaxID=3034837 RepID=UPI00308356BA